MTLKETINVCELLLDLCRQNKVGQVERLWIHGFGVNWQDEKTGDTPLHIAVSNQSVLLVRSILDQYGVDLTIRNKEGKTALDIAHDLADDDMILRNF